MTTLLEERECPACGTPFVMFPWAPGYVVCAYCTEPPSTSTRRRKVHKLRGVQIKLPLVGRKGRR